jgi:hypothetical protein
VNNHKNSGRELRRQATHQFSQGLDAARRAALATSPRLPLFHSERYINIFRTGMPRTSVSRKSRPMWRYVRRV